MTSESSEAERYQPEARIHKNHFMLDLRQQVRHQERIIRSLIAERDSLTKELDSRLFLVEAQLRREQKHIESVLGEKEQLIQFQALQIHSLKQLLSQVSQVYPSLQNHRSSRRVLSKRYSIALDEYMKDHCVLSRALPVIVQGGTEGDAIAQPMCGRARSLPELRFRDSNCCQRLNERLIQDSEKTLQSVEYPPDGVFSEENLAEACKVCCRILSQEVLDEISSRKWTSDCDSEHSDSLDSGISSPSIKCRSMHTVFPSSVQNLYEEDQKRIDHSGTSPPSFLDPVIQKPRRSSSIGNFINRTFSSSSSQEKSKESPDIGARRHSSFSGSKESGEPSQKARFISSANRTFGTNHRSVTKPRDIKFRKLFKFRRRTEPEITTGEEYMTV